MILSTTMGAPTGVVDEKHNVIVNLGMRYFGERKKGTLTLAGLPVSALAWLPRHGGIKELISSTCDDLMPRPVNAPSPSTAFPNW